MYTVSTASDSRKLIDNILGPVANSARKTIIPTLAAQHHMANLSEHMQMFADQMAMSMSSAIGNKVDYPTALRRAILKHVLDSYYPELQKNSPLIATPSNITGMLSSTDDMAQVEAGEDFPFFKEVHFPQLADIKFRIDELRDSISLTRGLRFIPSFMASDFHNGVAKIVGKSGLKPAGIKRLNALLSLDIPTDDSKRSDEQKLLVTNIGDILQRVEAITNVAAGNTISMNLWELIILVDRETAIDPNIPAIAPSDMHFIMNQHRLAVLPVGAETDLSIKLASPSEDRDANMHEYLDLVAGWGVTTEDNGLDINLIDIVLNMAYRATSDLPASIGVVTLPLSVHPMSSIVNTMFNEGQDIFVPKIESAFMDEWLKIAAMGPKSPMKTEDLRIRLDNAIHRDRNSIPRRFIEALEEIITTRTNELYERYVDKRTVYKPIVHAPLDTTAFRVDASHDSIRHDEGVRVEASVPVIFHSHVAISKPAGSAEGYVLANKIDNDLIVESQPAAGPAAIMSELFRHRDPNETTKSHIVNYNTVMDRIKYDFGMDMTLDLRATGHQTLRVSDLLDGHGGTFYFKEDAELFAEREHVNSMSLPRTNVTMNQSAVIHQYANSAVQFGVIGGTLASGLNARWADVIMDAATRVCKLYATTGMGAVEREPNIVETYTSKSYIERKVNFNTYFVPVDIVGHSSVWRFLNSFHTQKMVRERIDTEVLYKLDRHHLFVNMTLYQDIINYSATIANSLISNFDADSEGLKLFRDFINGRLSEQDMMKLRNPAAAAVFNTTMALVFDKIDKRDTIVTLIVVQALMEQFKEV